MVETEMSENEEKRKLMEKWTRESIDRQVAFPEYHRQRVLEDKLRDEELLTEEETKPTYRQKLKAVKKVLGQACNSAAERAKIFVKSWAGMYGSFEEAEEFLGDSEVDEEKVEIPVVAGAVAAYFVPTMITVLSLLNMYGGGPEATGPTDEGNIIAIGSIIANPLLYDGIRNIRRTVREAYEEKLEEVLSEE